jgi:hypothetical protein
MATTLELFKSSEFFCQFAQNGAVLEIFSQINLKYNISLCHFNGEKKLQIF